MPNLENARKAIADRVTPPVVRWLAGTPLTPDALTWLGFLLTLGAAALIVTRHPVIAGGVVLLAGVFDLLDGALARATGRESRAGAVLDSTLDRVSEAALLLALLAVFARDGQAWEALLAGIALAGSFLVSYIRARMEGLGIACRSGFFTRPERVVLLALGLLLSGFSYALVAALGLIAGLSLVSAGQRLLYARRHAGD